MGFAYEDLRDEQLEDLTLQIMKQLFGPAVQGFATGPDGGRDARFNGTAERFPSAAGPWVGVTIGQAKHTLALNAHYSDASFSGPAKTSVLSKEIIRINKLVDAGEVDNYILFSNRRLGGVAAAAIIARVAKDAGLPAGRIYLAGVEYLDDYIRQHPEVLTWADIDPVDGPLIPSSYDLAEVILAIAEELNAPAGATNAGVVARTSYAQKNNLNQMSADFADRLSKNYMKYTRTIQEFLAEPANAESLERYEATVEDFQLKIIAKRQDYQSFDDVFNYLVDALLKRDSVLASNPRLVRAMLFYMYWYCDIGKTPDAPTQ